MLTKIKGMLALSEILIQNEDYWFANYVSDE